MTLNDTIWADAPDGGTYLAKIVGYVARIGVPSVLRIEYLQGPFDTQIHEMRDF